MFSLTYKDQKILLKLASIAIVYYSTLYGGFALGIPVGLIVRAFYIAFKDHHLRSHPGRNHVGVQSFCKISGRNQSKSNSAEWVNVIIKKMWLNYRTYFNTRFREEIWPLIVEELKNKLGIFGTVHLNDFHIGDQAPRLKSIESWIENNNLLMDIVANYDGNALISISFDEKLLEIPVVVKDVKVKDAHMRVVLKNWTHHLPIISGVQFSFIEPPSYDCSISRLEGIADIPGFDEMVMHIVNVKLLKRMVLPRMLMLPIKLPLSIVKPLREHFPVKTQFNSRALMLAPLMLIRVAVEEIDHSTDETTYCTSQKEPIRYATICMGGQTQNFCSDAKKCPKNLGFEKIFPVEHVYKQKVVVTIFNEYKIQIGKVTELVANISKAQKIYDWYNFEDSEGRVKIEFEAIPVSNKRRDSAEVAKPYGVLSIFLGQLDGRVATKPEVYIYMHQRENGKVEEWTSLEPLASKNITNINEGTLMFVENIRDVNSCLELKVWNCSGRSWIGEATKVYLKDFGDETFKDLDILLDKETETTLSVSLSLYQVSLKNLT